MLTAVTIRRCIIWVYRTIYRRKCVEIVEQRDNFDQAQVAKIETAKDAMKVHLCLVLCTLF